MRWIKYIYQGEDEEPLCLMRPCADAKWEYYRNPNRLRTMSPIDPPERQRCPFCNGLLFENTRTCPGCGAPR